jgi:hypothetical protein
MGFFKIAGCGNQDECQGGLLSRGGARGRTMSKYRIGAGALRVESVRSTSPNRHPPSGFSVRCQASLKAPSRKIHADFFSASGFVKTAYLWGVPVASHIKAYSGCFVGVRSVCGRREFLDCPFGNH